MHSLKCAPLRRDLSHRRAAFCAQGPSVPRTMQSVWQRTHLTTTWTLRPSSSSAMAGREARTTRSYQSCARWVASHALARDICTPGAVMSPTQVMTISSETYRLPSAYRFTDAAHRRRVLHCTGQHSCQTCWYRSAAVALLSPSIMHALSAAGPGHQLAMLSVPMLKHGSPDLHTCCRCCVQVAQTVATSWSSALRVNGAATRPLCDLPLGS
jgi:hypothetical protein